MRHDGGLAIAIAARRTGWAAEAPSDIEENVLLTLESSDDAKEAWISLSERKKGRWRLEVKPGIVLHLVIRSAVLAAMRDEIYNLRKTTKNRYSQLTGAAGLLFEYFLERTGLSREAFWRLNPGEAVNDEILGARHLNWILDYLSFSRICDLMDVSDLPRPGKRRGPYAEARVFEHCLCEFLERAYGRPCDRFVLAVSSVLHPKAGASDESLLAKCREREDARRHRELEELQRRIDWSECSDSEPDVTHPSWYGGSDLFAIDKVSTDPKVAAHRRLIRYVVHPVLPGTTFPRGSSDRRRKG